MKKNKHIIGLDYISLEKRVLAHYAQFVVGTKVHYQPSHYNDNEFENGIVKEVPDHACGSVRVVYNCGGDWKHYQDYTSALTRIEDLKLGWR